jgi:carbon-monoxide dehydrogenase small subunit
MNLNINNKKYPIASPPETTLLNCLREELRLTGTKRGCDIGLCGTCTVLVNGMVKRACKVLIKQLKETDAILTIEGLSNGDKLHPIQEAFIEAGAVQCGFCTPGMVLSTKALLDKKPNPTRDEIKKALQGNLCRCTGYQQIFEAVELAVKKMIKCHSRGACPRKF